MKHLKLHIILWWLLVLLFTLCDLMLWIIIYMLYILWEFNIPKDFWAKLHQSSYSDERSGLVYRDKNIIETFKRRFRGDFSI